MTILGTHKTRGLGYDITSSTTTTNDDAASAVDGSAAAVTDIDGRGSANSSCIGCMDAKWQELVIALRRILRIAQALRFLRR